MGSMTDIERIEDTLAAAQEAVAALRARLAADSSSFRRAVELLDGCRGKIIVTGLGKSGLIARKIAATLASTGSSATAINAADALHGDLGTVGPEDAVLMLSNSGATRELVEMLPALKRLGVPTVGLLGRVDSALGRSVDVALDVAVAREGCPLNLAPMASTTLALVAGDALAAALMDGRGFQPEDFALRHPAGLLGRRLLLRAQDVMQGAQGLPVVGLEATFRELVAELTRHNLGAVCVVDADGMLLGIVSDGDVRRAVLGEDPFSRTATDLMTAEPLVTAPDALLDEVLRQMEAGGRKVYVLPVVDEARRLRGMVRMHDIVAG